MKPLTKKQQKVKYLLLLGYTRKAIAIELGVCRGTVDKHTNAIYNYYGVHNVYQLIAKIIFDKPSFSGTWAFVFLKHNNPKCLDTNLN